MRFSYPRSVRAAAVDAVRAGRRPVQVAAELALSPTTVYAWLHADAPHLVRALQPCFRCSDGSRLPSDPALYAQLLGLYLGDGCLSRAPRAWVLRITCDDRWPGVAREVADVMSDVGARRVCRVAQPGCHDIQAHWQHWPCLFPQHRSGKKHTRPIVLEPWQQEVVVQHPGRLLRGLFFSDGWRGQNVAVKHGPDGFVTRYRYPRYEFTHRSDDIRRLCTDALDLLGIAWRRNGAWRISVARREAVAALDAHVGPKH